jgi:hypothetical protein
MADIVHKQRFYGGLTSDTHPRQIAEGDYVYMLNMRNSKVEGNQWGGAVNVKGNVLIPFQLPVGENVAIGFLEDKQKQRVYYWVWNSFNDHQMLCYDVAQNVIYEVVRGDLLKLRREWLITQSSIVDGKYVQWGETKVDGLDIEGNAPRYVDVERAVVNGKHCVFDVVVASPSFNANTTSYQLVVNTPSGQFGFSLITGSVANDSIPNDKANLYGRLKNAINAAAGNLVKADDCGGCKLEIEVLQEGNTWVQVLSTSDRFYTLPRNRYHRNLDETSIKLGRLVPVCQPEVELFADESFGQNLIQDKYFQFSVRYVYWDGQKSTFGSFSPIAGFSTSCAVERGAQNAIRVDFSNEILLDEVRLADIKYVEIAVREGNEGSFRSVTKIDACDLDFPRQTFVFRNDGAYPVISDEEAYRAANQIPLLAASHISVDDISWWGGTVERYDNLECLEAKAKVEFGDDIDGCAQEFVTIRGRIRIENNLSNRNRGIVEGYISQPIWTRGDGNYYFGGIDPRRSQDEPGFTDNEIRVPLAGFTVYLAGTRYFATSRQIDPTNGVVADSEGAFFVRSRSEKNSVLDMAESSGIWSEFEIRNVPKGGSFVLRVASHKITNDGSGGVFDISSGLDWQKTSTYVNRIGSIKRSEIVINTNIPGDLIDLSFGNEIVIDDIRNPRGVSVGAWGYVVDAISNHNGDVESVRAATPVENVLFSGGGGFQRFITSAGGRTDANGFFYFFADDSCSIDRFLLGNRVLWQNGQQLYREAFYTDLPDNPTAGSNLSGLQFAPGYVVYNHDTVISEGRATFIKFKVVDQFSAPVAGLKFVYTNTSRIAVSDVNGDVSLRVYSFGNTRDRSGLLVPIYEDECCIDGLLKSVSANISNFGLTPEGGSYNVNIPFVLQDFLAEVSSYGYIWKRRNTVRLGLKYYDEYSRSGKVQYGDSMSVYIPFWTEEGASKGLATVSYEIAHKPPIWAKKYQVVRALNPIYSRYLQFIVGEPRYVRTFGSNVTDTSFGARDATEVYIPLKPLIDFADENSGSILAWDFSPGDRITFMRNELGSWFDGYFDFRVENDRVTPDDATYLVIKFDQSQPELKPGAVIEVYSPKAQIETDLFYEIGECYPIINPGTEDRLHGAGFNGLSQTASQPATGEIRFGDTYLQTREMPLITDDINSRARTIFESVFADETLVNSRVQSIGRFDVVDKDYAQVFYFTRHRFSNRYLPVSNINGLNQFIENSYLRDDNGTEIDRAFGVCISTQFAGSLVLSIHQFKCVPIYTNATPVFDLQGGSVLTKSRSIATIAQPIREDKGSQNPESVFVENGNVYGYDRLKNVWWRYGFNGLFDISDYEMNSYFDQLFARLDGVADKRILAAFDRQKDELVVSVPGLGETIAFNETIAGDAAKNRWFGFYSYVPDLMGIFGEKFISWKGGGLWVHDQNPVRGSFYGTKYPCGVDFYANTASEAKKVFKGLRIKASDKFVTERRGVEVYEGERGVVMVSELRDAHVYEYEGDWWADFLRDVDDREFANIVDPELRSVTALLRGRVLRGDYALVKLRNNSAELVTLWSVDVVSFVSHKTKE